MITLIRHTTPEIAEGICYGQSDLELKKTYVFELQIIKSKLNTENQIVYSSPLKRCSIMANDLFSNYKIDDRLMELNFGDWELKKWDDINDDNAKLWFNDYINTTTPNGESFKKMYNRVENFYNENMKNTNKDITIITHSGVISCLYLIIKKLPISNLFDLKPQYGEVIMLDIT